MDCSFAATQMWQPVMTGLFEALGILVASTGVLYAAVLALGSLGDRRATRAQLTRLRSVAAGAREDHQQVAARYAHLVATPAERAAGRQVEPVDERPAHRVLDHLGHADDAHTAVAALMGGDDPDLTHRGEEIDEAVAHYRHAVDRLTSAWTASSVGAPATDGPGCLDRVRLRGHVLDERNDDRSGPTPTTSEADVVVAAGWAAVRTSAVSGPRTDHPPPGVATSDDHSDATNDLFARGPR